jgi:pimeloyl-ACP methyl ester carboxylesterase
VSLSHPAIEDYEAEFARTMRPGSIVCGFSLGAIVAAHYADRLDASAMLLFGLNPLPDDPAKRSGRFELEQDVMSQGASSAMTRHMPSLSGPAPTAARATILEMSERCAPLISAQTQLALSRPGALPALRGAQFPVLAITGSRDSAAPLDLAKEAAANAPKGRVVPLPGLGHYALIEDPHACSTAVAKVFKELF